MGFIWSIIRFVLMSLGLVTSMLIALYFYGDLKYIEPAKTTLASGQVMTFKTPEKWCGISPYLYKIAQVNLPANEILIKRVNCKLKKAGAPAKVSDLVRIQALSMADSAQQIEVLRVCSSKNKYGLTAFKDNNSIYCSSPEKEGIKAVTAFTRITDSDLVVTSLIVDSSENAKAETAELIKLVSSYKINKQ